MRREKIIKLVFGILLAATTIFGVVLYVTVCSEMRNDENSGDILVKLPLAFMGIFFLAVGIPIYLAEFDLYRNILYFSREKSERKSVNTIFHGIATILSLGILCGIMVMFLIPSNPYMILLSVWKLCFINYVLLKGLHFLIKKLGSVFYS